MKVRILLLLLMSVAFYRSPAHLFTDVHASGLCQAAAGTGPLNGQSTTDIEVANCAAMATGGLTATGVATVSNKQVINPGPISLYGPCDVIAAGGQTCVAAHSVTRRMFGAYTGPLFQLTRASGSPATTDIGTTSLGFVDLAAVNSFCAGTSCYFSDIYDQTGNANHLPQATVGNMAPWLTYNTNALPVLVTTPNLAYYRNRASTTNIPTGTASATTYVVRGTDIYGTCCGSYGRYESTVTGTPQGASWALGWENYLVSGPAIGVDQEIVLPNTVIPNYPRILAHLNKYTSSTNLSLDEYWSASNPSPQLPIPALQTKPVETPVVQSGISMGEGGDGSTSPIEFFEGAIASGATSLATDAALATNVSAFYGAQAQGILGPVDLLYDTGVCAGSLCTNHDNRDFLAAVGGAWGLRQMRGSYTGYAATIRRVSDSTTQNVGFSSTGSFDDASAQAFCGSSIATFTGSISGTTLTVSGVTGTIAIGHSLYGNAGSTGSVSSGTMITAGSGTSWTVTPSQTVASIPMYTTTTCYVSKLYNQSIAGQNNDPDGSVLDLAQATTSAQPQLVFNDINGRTAMRFNGSDVLCSGSSLPVGITPSLAINAVATRNGAFTTRQAIIAGGNQTQFGFNNAANQAYMYGGAGTVSSQTMTDSAWHILTGQLNVNTTANGDTSLYIDNMLAPTTYGGPGSFVGIVSTVTLGGGNCTSSEFVTGDIAEVEILAIGSSSTAANYTGSLTPGQISTLQSNEETYYGLTPTASYAQVSGFGAAPSIVSSQASIGANGYATSVSVSVNVGTGGTANSGTILLPQSSGGHGWACGGGDTGTTPTGSTQPTGSTPTSATFTNYSRTTGLAVAWTASEVLQLNCAPN